ncbi:T9SS type A sorting domain-containing protein [uncultured Planktosalinus sp.]|uniref:T9SS type A sorting domain-containing protein n=1 Tax=uncultured Planktosalinus sp. TaxID=1810935 RepID=UPI0030D96A42
MMNFRVLIFFPLFLFSFQALSQWQEHLIYEDETSGSAKLILVDIDNDGLLDIVTFRSQFAIYWHKNLDGLGNYALPLLIVENLPTVRGMAVGDLTGNGFKDLVFSTQDVVNMGFNLRWMEHLDGNGNFGSPQIIPENPNTMARAIVLEDIDGDGMLDIVVSANAASDRSISWYRNLGSGNFSSSNVVVTDFSNGFGIAVGDIDGDGNLDIVSGTSNTGVMSWFENLDGQGDFGPPIPIGSSGNPGYNVLRLHLVDIDGDGDLDVVGSSILTQAFAWWENLDGQGSFGSERFIELEHPITGIFPADIDNDGDIDLFTLSPGYMRWYENLDGLGNFGEEQLITDSLPSAVTIEAADINGNGKMDPVTASQTNNTILWFENNLLSTNEYTFNNVVIYPNPVEDTLKIKTDLFPIEFSIYNSKGQKAVKFKWEPGQKEIDVSALSSGWYLVEFIYKNSKEKIKFIKK